ncbi:hypothetical protein [Arenibacter algicola]|uniref:Lipoprotein n=1 Tax=Arenibacter algicola TaxID=616991 RepID=A0A221UWD5_9FLAO|nr:hypothetical protein [Arenibacter algicola]ASO05416.1 hypothetical protein AREALGSMS7_01954 [Arenibacter algicola]|tara:strand:- start:52 stop:528 length:477 start_codon:yes stop_codon:yes gene_type:complete
MKKLILIICLPIILFSCQNKNQTEKLVAEIKDLKQRNDSLEKVVNGIKDKYVFDSLTIRQIPHYGNTNKLNSIHQEEFVFVGYNSNGKTSVVIGDSTYFDNGMKIYDGDSLPLKNGGFEHKIKLTQDRTSYRGILKTENDYGKSFETPFSSLIGAIKN